MDGFDVLGKMMLVILPFWPLFLIGGIVWYFVRRNKKLKEEKEFLRQQLLNQQKVSQSAVEKWNPSENSLEKSVDETMENDYSKYLPKN
jgi:biopolymer transport protein ExbB/TolQ